MPRRSCASPRAPRVTIVLGVNNFNASNPMIMKYGIYRRDHGEREPAPVNRICTSSVLAINILLNNGWFDLTACKKYRYILDQCTICAQSSRLTSVTPSWNIVGTEYIYERMRFSASNILSFHKDDFIEIITMIDRTIQKVSLVKKMFGSL